MIVYAWLDTLDYIGGGIKHGLSLLEPLIGIHEITVLHASNRGLKRSLEETYGLSLPGVKFLEYQDQWQILVLTRQADLFINLSCPLLVESFARKSILMTYFPVQLDDYALGIGWRRRLGHGIQRIRERFFTWLTDHYPALGTNSFGLYRSRQGFARATWHLPIFALRKLAWASGFSYQLGRPSLDSYHLILANSQFTASWITRLYHRESIISYPPIDVVRFQASQKEKLILTVGRFGHAGKENETSKKLEVLVEAFKRLHDEGLLDGWTLWVCGGSNETPASQAQIAELEQTSVGYPVSLGVNLDFDLIRDLYGRASLYWHAMGHGVDIEAQPWRCEHFGMTTVEAMAAGCIPMVFNAGGQAEIVTHGVTGFLWRTVDELRDSVRWYLDGSDDDRSRLSQAAEQRSHDFGWAAFRERTRQFYRSLDVACAD